MTGEADEGGREGGRELVRSSHVSRRNAKRGGGGGSGRGGLLIGYRGVIDGSEDAILVDPRELSFSSDFLEREKAGGEEWKREKEGTSNRFSQREREGEGE